MEGERVKRRKVEREGEERKCSDGGRECGEKERERQRERQRDRERERERDPRSAGV
jgi:hypothetical protein